MERDIKELLKKHKDEGVSTLRPGHESRFEQKLDDALHKPAVNRFFYLKIAAAVVILVTAGYFVMHMVNSNGETNTPTIVRYDNEEPENNTFSLGDISPDLKKVEDYYVASITLELSEIQVTNQNRSLFDEYMKRLSELNDEYQNLTEELRVIGPNEQTITALIENLNLRLQMLYQLKERLTELKETKNDKQI